MQKYPGYKCTNLVLFVGGTVINIREKARVVCVTAREKGATERHRGLMGNINFRAITWATFES